MLFTGIGALIVVTIASYFLRQKHRWKGKEKTTATSLKEYLHLERKKKRGKHGPYYVATTFIGVKSKGHTEFMITKESGKDRFLKKLGISSEFHTKDSDFDNSFYITCDDSQVNNSLAMRPEAREIIKELFTNYPIECLIHSKGKLWVEYNLEAPITDIETIVDKLNEILPLFQKMQVGFVSKLVDKNNIKASIMMGFHTAALFIGIAGIVGVMIFDILDVAKLAKITLMAGLSASLFWFVVITVVMAGSSRINLVLTDFLIIGIVGIFLLSLSAVTDYNIEFDTSRPEIRQQQIVNKYTYGCGKRNRSTCYKIVINDWVKPSEKLSFKVSYSEYSKAVIGGYVTLDVRQGALGVRWVKSRNY